MRVYLVVPSYNCGVALQNCFAHIQAQTMRPEVVVVNDASTEKFHTTLCELYCEDNGWNLVTNDVNRKAPYTIKQGIEASGALKNDVIFILDGDDFLPPIAVEYIYNIYTKYRRLWLTYGNYQPHPEGWTVETPATEYPTFDRWEREFRNNRVQRFNHPLTFKRGLWDRLDDADLQDNSGNWFTFCYDEVIMTPLLELAAPDHYAMVDEMLYYYNTNNPISENALSADGKNLQEQLKVQDIWGRAKKPSLVTL